MKTLARLAPNGQGYLEDLKTLAQAHQGKCVSLLLYGSAASGGYSGTVSDVDVMVVMDDSVSREGRKAFRQEVEALEMKHGLLTADFWQRSPRQRAVDKLLGFFFTTFVVPRAAFLKGDAAGLFGLDRARGALATRLVFANILWSSVTFWGEDLRPAVQGHPITRTDLLKSLHQNLSFALMSALLLPVRPDATKYAMMAVKKSLHATYYCYGLPPVPVEDKVEHFIRRAPRLAPLRELLELRSTYRPAPGFVLRSPALVTALHGLALKDCRFPLPLRLGG